MHNEEPRFLEDLRQALRTPSPAALIEVASMLAALEDLNGAPDDSDAPLPQLSLPLPLPLPTNDTPYPYAFAVLELAPMFVESDRPETNAVLRVWAEMLGDDMLRRRVRNSVSTREHPLWLDALHGSRATTAFSVSDLFGEDETVMLEVEISDQRFTMVCALRHLGGTVLDDAYLVPLSVEAALSGLPADVTAKAVQQHLDLTDARHRIAEAVKQSDLIYPPVDTDSWPAHRPALEWVLQLLPENANANANALTEAAFDPDEEDAKFEERARLAQAFHASPEGQALPAKLRQEAELVLEFQHNYGTGDTLRWGPQFVEYLMLDLYPRKYAAPDRILLQLPRLLTAIVTWANARSGLPATATRDVLRLIKNLTPEYREIVTSGSADPFPFGAGAFSDPGLLETLELNNLFASSAGDPAGDPALEPALEPEFAAMYEALQQAELKQSIPPAFREAVARSQAPDAELGEDPLLDFLLETFPDEQPKFSPETLARFSLSMLIRDVGGEDALQALDATPLPLPSIGDALDRYNVPDDVRPRLHRVGEIIIEQGGALFANPELVTAALRVLARSAACDPALYRRHSKDENTAAAACWIAAWVNEWLDSYGESGHTAKALGAAFGLKSSPRSRAETLVRAMGAHVYTRSGDFFLGDAGLFVSDQRALMLHSRDAFDK